MTPNQLRGAGAAAPRCPLDLVSMLDPSMLDIFRERLLALLRWRQASAKAATEATMASSGTEGHLLPTAYSSPASWDHDDGDVVDDQDDDVVDLSDGSVAGGARGGATSRHHAVLRSAMLHAMTRGVSSHLLSGIPRPLFVTALAELGYHVVLRAAVRALSAQSSQSEPSKTAHTMEQHARGSALDALADRHRTLSDLLLTPNSSQEILSIAGCKSNDAPRDDSRSVASRSVLSRAVRCAPCVSAWHKPLRLQADLSVSANDNPSTGSPPRGTATAALLSDVIRFSKTAIVAVNQAATRLAVASLGPSSHPDAAQGERPPAAAQTSLMSAFVAIQLAWLDASAHPRLLAASTLEAMFDAPPQHHQSTHVSGSSSATTRRGIAGGGGPAAMAEFRIDPLFPFSTAFPHATQIFGYYAHGGPLPPPRSAKTAPGASASLSAAVDSPLIWLESPRALRLAVPSWLPEGQVSAHANPLNILDDPVATATAAAQSSTDGRLGLSTASPNVWVNDGLVSFLVMLHDTAWYKRYGGGGADGPPTTPAAAGWGSGGAHLTDASTGRPWSSPFFPLDIHDTLLRAASELFTQIDIDSCDTISWSAITDYVLEMNTQQLTSPVSLREVVGNKKGRGELSNVTASAPPPAQATTTVSTATCYGLNARLSREIDDDYRSVVAVTNRATPGDCFVLTRPVVHHVAADSGRSNRRSGSAASQSGVYRRAGLREVASSTRPTTTTYSTAPSVLVDARTFNIKMHLPVSNIIAAAALSVRPDDVYKVQRAATVHASNNHSHRSRDEAAAAASHDGSQDGGLHRDDEHLPSEWRASLARIPSLDLVPHQGMSRSELERQRHHLVCINGELQLYIFQLHEAPLVGTFTLNEPRKVCQCPVTPTAIGVSTDFVVTGDRNGVITVYDSVTLLRVGLTLDDAIMGRHESHTERVTEVFIDHTAHHHHVISTAMDGFISTLDLNSMSVTHRFCAEPSGVACACWSREHQLFVIQSADRVTKVFVSTHNNESLTLFDGQHPHLADIIAVAVLEGPGHILTVDCTGLLKVWGVVGLRCLTSTWLAGGSNLPPRAEEDIPPELNRRRTGDAAGGNEEDDEEALIMAAHSSAAGGGANHSSEHRHALLMKRMKHCNIFKAGGKSAWSSSASSLATPQTGSDGGAAAGAASISHAGGGRPSMALLLDTSTAPVRAIVACEETCRIVAIGHNNACCAELAASRQLRRAHMDPVKFVAIAHNSLTIVTASHFEIKVWSMSLGRFLFRTCITDGMVIPLLPDPERWASLAMVTGRADDQMGAGESSSSTSAGGSSSATSEANGTAAKAVADTSLMIGDITALSVDVTGEKLLLGTRRGFALVVRVSTGRVLKAFPPSETPLGKLNEMDRYQRCPTSGSTVTKAPRRRQSLTTTTPRPDDDDAGSGGAGANPQRPQVADDVVARRMRLKQITSTIRVMMMALQRNPSSAASFASGAFAAAESTSSASFGALQPSMALASSSSFGRSMSSGSPVAAAGSTAGASPLMTPQEAQQQQQLTAQAAATAAQKRLRLERDLQSLVHALSFADSEQQERWLEMNAPPEYSVVDVRLDSATATIVTSCSDGVVRMFSDHGSSRMPMKELRLDEDDHGIRPIVASVWSPFTTLVTTCSSLGDLLSISQQSVTGTLAHDWRCTDVVTSVAALGEYPFVAVGTAEGAVFIHATRASAYDVAIARAPPVVAKLDLPSMATAFRTAGPSHTTNVSTPQPPRAPTGSGGAFAVSSMTFIPGFASLAVAYGNTVCVFDFSAWLHIAEVTPGSAESVMGTASARENEGLGGLDTDLSASGFAFGKPAPPVIVSFDAGRPRHLFDGPIPLVGMHDVTTAAHLHPTGGGPAAASSASSSSSPPPSPLFSLLQSQQQVRNATSFAVTSLAAPALPLCPTSRNEMNATVSACECQEGELGRHGEEEECRGWSPGALHTVLVVGCQRGHVFLLDYSLRHGLVEAIHLVYGVPIYVAPSSVASAPPSRAEKESEGHCSPAPPYPSERAVLRWELPPCWRPLDEAATSIGQRELFRGQMVDDDLRAVMSTLSLNGAALTGGAGGGILPDDQAMMDGALSLSATAAPANGKPRHAPLGVFALTHVVAGLVHAATPSPRSAQPITSILSALGVLTLIGIPDPFASHVRQSAGGSQLHRGGTTSSCEWRRICDAANATYAILVQKRCRLAWRHPVVTMPEVPPTQRINPQHPHHHVERGGGGKGVFLSASVNAASSPSHVFAIAAMKLTVDAKRDRAYRMDRWSLVTEKLFRAGGSPLTPTASAAEHRRSPSKEVIVTVPVAASHGTARNDPLLSSAAEPKQNKAVTSSSSTSSRLGPHDAAVSRAAPAGGLGGGALFRSSVRKSLLPGGGGVGVATRDGEGPQVTVTTQEPTLPVTSHSPTSRRNSHRTEDANGHGTHNGLSLSFLASRPQENNLASSLARGDRRTAVDRSHHLGIGDASSSFAVSLGEPHEDSSRRSSAVFVPVKRSVRHQVAMPTASSILVGQLGYGDGAEPSDHVVLNHNSRVRPHATAAIVSRSGATWLPRPPSINPRSAPVVFSPGKNPITGSCTAADREVDPAILARATLCLQPHTATDTNGGVTTVATATDSASSPPRRQNRSTSPANRSASSSVSPSRRKRPRGGLLTWKMHLSRIPATVDSGTNTLRMSSHSVGAAGDSADGRVEREGRPETVWPAPSAELALLSLLESAGEAPPPDTPSASGGLRTGGDAADGESSTALHDAYASMSRPIVVPKGHPYMLVDPLMERMKAHAHVLQQAPAAVRAHQRASLSDRLATRTTASSSSMTAASSGGRRSLAGASGGMMADDLRVGGPAPPDVTGFTAESYNDMAFDEPPGITSPLSSHQPSDGPRRRGPRHPNGASLSIRGNVTRLLHGSGPDSRHRTMALASHGGHTKATTVGVVPTRFVAGGENVVC